MITSSHVIIHVNGRPIRVKPACTVGKHEKASDQCFNRSKYSHNWKLIHSRSNLDKWKWFCLEDQLFYFREILKNPPNFPETCVYLPAGSELRPPPPSSVRMRPFCDCMWRKISFLLLLRQLSLSENPFTSSPEREREVSERGPEKTVNFVCIDRGLILKVHRSPEPHTWRSALEWNWQQKEQNQKLFLKKKRKKENNQ